MKIAITTIPSMLSLNMCVFVHSGSVEIEAQYEERVSKFAIRGIMGKVIIDIPSSLLSSNLIFSIGSPRVILLFSKHNTPIRNCQILLGRRS